MIQIVKNTRHGRIRGVLPNQRLLEFKSDDDVVSVINISSDVIDLEDAKLTIDVEIDMVVYMAIVAQSGEISVSLVSLDDITLS